MYVALVRVGEVSGTLDKILQVLASDRSRAEALRRKLADALRYPAFLLFAAICVLVFFLMFVLPQFGACCMISVPRSIRWRRVSSTFRVHECAQDVIGVAAMLVLASGLLLARQATFRTALILRLVRLPIVRTIVALHQTAIFCRNLDVLLTAGVPLTTSLRIIADMMAAWGDDALWTRVVERVRQGGKLSDALDESGWLAGDGGTDIASRRRNRPVAGSRRARGGVL